MKKIILIFFMINSMIIMGQDINKGITLKKNIIRFEPFPLITKGYNLSYERLLSKKRSITISTFFRDFQLEKPNIDNNKIRRLKFSLGYNFYFQKEKKSPYGWHIGPRIDYDNTTTKSSKKTKSTNSDLLIGGETGYQLGFGKSKNFLLDLSGGVFMGIPIKRFDNKNSVFTTIDINIRFGYLF